MAIVPFNLTVTDGQGTPLSGAEIWICTQPATTTSLPPSPLATVYADAAGDAGMNPFYSDGFGQAQPYVQASGAPYTIVYNHPLFAAPLVYADQYPNGGSGGASISYVDCSTTAGTITGAIPGSVFVLPSAPPTGSLNLFQNGMRLTLNLGYTISGATVTLATALQTGDSLAANWTA